ncbi:MAG: 3-phosphoshikimate 1-carboxyvinyltransferase [Bacteroidales bacterium]|nr:3-phosphoshikimate 1-carboxyvinyltransferase [Bacteroidales bacterium]MCF8336616.1 3-phosphoshikimate 1-carboxyvinyltransferase [Bacteroidales bacterium]
MIEIQHAPANLRGSITLPASKSISNRVLIIRELSDTRFKIENISTSEDSQNLLKNLELIRARGQKVKEIDVGAAGTNMRFLTAVLAVSNGEYILKGSERMHQRPVKILVEALKKLGAVIEYLENEGYPPLRIKPGSLTGGSLEVPSGVSSQYISALMMIAPVLPRGLHLSLTGQTVSLPYIEMTAQIMESFGARVQWDEERISIAPTGYRRSTDFSVESDWSAASYWYAMAAAAQKSDLILKNFHNKSLQGDAVISDWFGDFGIKTEWQEKGVRIRKAGKPQIREFVKDFTNNPDLAQTFMALLPVLEIPGKLSGLQTLRIKETDRIKAMSGEMARFGIKFRLENEILKISPVKPGYTDEPVQTYQDHRMAMALSLLAYAVTPLKLDNENVVSKSYPDFWNDLQHLGFVIKSK